MFFLHLYHYALIMADCSNINILIKTEEKLQHQQLNQDIRITISKTGPESHLGMKEQHDPTLRHGRPHHLRPSRDQRASSELHLIPVAVTGHYSEHN